MTSRPCAARAFVLASVCAVGCVEEPRPGPALPDPILPTAAAPAPPPSSVTVPSASADASGPIAIVDEQPAPPPEPMPAVAFVAPKANQVIPIDKADGFLVRLDVQNWAVSPQAEHVHVVLDNEPYRAIYDLTAPLRLSDIAPNRPLSEGAHVLVAFPADAAYASIKPAKGKNPIATVTFVIAAKTGGASASGKRPRASDPMLVYSRPKGTYNGSSADRVLLDFYVLNAMLAQDRFHIRATVAPPTGEPLSLVVTRWAPLAITNLPNGDTKVRLELLDPDGRTVPGPWGRVERVITINRNAQDVAP